MAGKKPEELKIALKLSKEFVRAKLTELLMKPMHEIHDLSLDYDNMGMDVWLAKIIAIGVKEGDHQRLNFMFDRLIGKVTEVKEIRQVQPFAIESFSGDKTITLGMDEVTENEL